MRHCLLTHDASRQRDAGQDTELKIFKGLLCAAGFDLGNNGANDGVGPRPLIFASYEVRLLMHFRRLANTRRRFREPFDC